MTEEEKNEIMGTFLGIFFAMLIATTVSLILCQPAKASVVEAVIGDSCSEVCEFYNESCVGVGTDTAGDDWSACTRDYDGPDDCELYANATCSMVAGDQSWTCASGPDICLGQDTVWTHCHCETWPWTGTATTTTAEELPWSASMEQLAFGLCLSSIIGILWNALKKS